MLLADKLPEWLSLDQYHGSVFPEVVKYTAEVYLHLKSALAGIHINDANSKYSGENR